MGFEQRRSRDNFPVRPASQGTGHIVSRGPQPRGTAKPAPVVFVVDDDPGVREALSSLFRSVDLRVELFGSAADFLQHKRPEGASCLVLDIRLPGVSGLDFQAQLLKANIHTPIIFMTGHGDIPMSVRAMKAGAVDFLAKPFRDQDMLDAVAAALQRDREAREAEDSTAALRATYELLTAREREVMALVTAGLMNKQAAAQLGLSEITVKIHRGHAMKKMNARSLADLVRMAESLGLHQPKARQP
jgi:FixJ family two-component response regulator